MLTKEVIQKAKDDISYTNILLGLETEFFDDANAPFLAHTEGGKIFLNLAQIETIEQLRLANRHEILHHFEDSKSFQIAKGELLEALTEEDREQIHREYYLRYAGIYSPAQIEQGILDTEISIDLIVGNIAKEMREKYSPITNNLYELIVTNESPNKALAERLLNLSLTNRIEQSFAQATIWEKIFILNFYDGKTHILPTQKETKYAKIRADINAELERLYAFAEDPKNFEIYVKDNKELEREFESEVKALQTRGEGDLAKRFQNNKGTAMKEMAKSFSQQLHAEFKHIVDFIKTTEYEPAFKCLMLLETLHKTYKKDKNNEEEKTIVKPRDLHKSISGHMTLNDVVLKTIYNNLKDHSNFANLYFAGLELFNKSTSQKNEITLDGVQTFGMGKWLKFEGKQSNEKEYLKNAQNLASLVQDTPWCTKTLASSQLAQGDFFVFVDNSNHPHIAVKMSGNEIDEVRGLKGGNAQELEEEYRPVAIEFLTKNKNIQNGKEWLDKEEWNARLISYSKKIDDKTLQKSDIPQLLKDLSQQDYKSHIENSNKTDLRNKIRNNTFAHSVIAEHFSCKVEEISFEEVERSPKYKIIWENADFRNSQITDLGNLEFVGGHADFIDSKITDLGNLEYIGGYADFRNSQITDLGNLEFVGGYAVFRDSKITSLGNLEYIGGDADFYNSKITNLGNLEYIGGYADFYNSKVTNLGNLEYIGGDADFYNSKITNLGNLKYIDGRAVFRDSKITSIGNLEYIGGDADFYNSKITNLGNLEYIGGDAVFRDSRITDLGNLKHIGGNVNFDYSKVTNLGNLEHIGRNAYFRDSQITNLGNLEYIGGDADFYNSKITNLGNLEHIGGYAYFRYSQITNLGNLEHIGRNAYFRDSKITDLGNLKEVKGELFLDDKQRKLFADRIEERGGDFYLKNALSKDDTKEKI